MSIARKIITGDAGEVPSDPSDPYFADVSLLLDGDGTNGANNNTFTDSSSNNFVVTKAGDVAQGSFSPYATSEPLNMTTDGGSGYLEYQSRLYVPSSSSLDVGSKMSAEAWIYVDELPSGNIGTNGQCAIFGRWVASGNNRSWMILLGGDGQLGFWFSPAGSTTYSKCNSATGAIQKGQWHHVAVSWDGSNQRLFVDGKLSQTQPNTVGPKRAVAAPFEVNSYNNGTTATAAKIYISDVRFFNNPNAPWTSNFTPPSRPVSAATSAVTLNFQDAGIYNLTGKNNIETLGTAAVSTAQKKFGTGSLDLSDTTSNKELSIIENGDSLTFGTGDFTVETWVYFLSSTGIQLFIDWRATSGNQGLRPALYVDGSRIKFYNSSVRISSNVISDRTNQWLHVALVRSSGQTKLYIDGTQEGVTYNDSTNYLGTQDGKLYIGAQKGTYQTNGYLDDCRITKGIARYTGNFTPPTEALPKQ